MNLIVKRNRVLEEIIMLSHLTISEFEALDKEDLDHFFLTRKYFIEALVQTEDQIIAKSMMDWSTFKFDANYRAEYILLSQEKDEKLGVIVNQDKLISDLMEREYQEKIA